MSSDTALELAEYIIADHEGCVAHAYKDSTSSGYLTIGYGRCVDQRLGGGITEDEAHMLLVNDIERTDRELRTAFKWFHHLDDQRRAAILDMTFNLGLPRFVGFSKAIAALDAGDFEEAAAEVLDSKYARQVGKRAHDIADMIRGSPEVG